MHRLSLNCSKNKNCREVESNAGLHTCQITALTTRLSRFFCFPICFLNFIPPQLTGSAQQSFTACRCRRFPSLRPRDCIVLPFASVTASNPQRSGIDSRRPCFASARNLLHKLGRNQRQWQREFNCGGHGGAQLARFQNDRQTRLLLGRRGENDTGRSGQLPRPDIHDAEEISKS